MHLTVSKIRSSYNETMRACVAAGQWQKALGQLENLVGYSHNHVEPNVETFELMMESLVAGGLHRECIAVLSSMTLKDISPSIPCFEPLLVGG